MSSGLVSNNSKSKLRTTPAITRYSSARARLHGGERQLFVLVPVGHLILLLSSTPSSSLSKGHKATVLLPLILFYIEPTLWREFVRIWENLRVHVHIVMRSTYQGLYGKIGCQHICSENFSYSENVEHLTPAGITQCL
jgi:hypothetical protein